MIWNGLLKKIKQNKNMVSYGIDMLFIIITTLELSLYT